MGQSSQFLLWDSMNFSSKSSLSSVSSSVTTLDQTLDMVTETQINQTSDLFADVSIHNNLNSITSGIAYPSVLPPPALHENDDQLKSVLQAILVSRINSAAPLVPTENLKVVGKGIALTPFHAAKPPSISVLDYLDRLIKYAYCSNSCLILALYYMEKLASVVPSLRLNIMNAHRLMITALMLAAKFHDDLYYNNVYYAKVGGISLGEINNLELYFLKKLKFSLHVPLEHYTRFEHLLIDEVFKSRCPQSIHAKKVLLEAGYTGSSDSSYQDLSRSDNASRQQRTYVRHSPISITDQGFD